jgi:hypothetical protein
MRRQGNGSMCINLIVQRTRRRGNVLAARDGARDKIKVCVRWAMKITAGLLAEFTATSCDAKMSLYQEHLHVKVSVALRIGG